MKKNRVVITACRFISLLGNSFGEVQKAFKENLFPVIRENKLSLDHFDLREIIGRNKDIKYLSRGNQLAAACAIPLALSLQEEEREDMGLFLGAGPNFDFPESENNVLWILNFLPNSAASFISKMTGIHGEALTLGSACAASLQAIGLAYEKIAYPSHASSLKRALAGGADSRLSPLGLKAYADCKALYSSPKDPNEFYSPFSQERVGFIPGEGGAIFLLEELEEALKRKAPILGEIIGTASSSDAYNMTAPHPEALYSRKAILKALESAGLHPREIDLISSHGTGTPLNDEAEARLIKDLFPHAFVMAHKSWLGHLASACGALELALSLSILSSRKGQGQVHIPCIRNLKERGSAFDLNFFSPPARPKHLLLENFGFGGQNTALIVKRWEE